MAPDVTASRGRFSSEHTPGSKGAVMPETPAELLAEAIEAHRDAKYNGGQVTDPLDSTLYDAAVWFRVWQDHAADPNAPILDV